MLNHYVHAYLRALAGLRAHRVGPFLVSFDDHDAGLFRNYAVPDDGVDPTPDQVAEHCQVDRAGVFDCLVWVGHTGFVVPRRRRCTGGTATRWRSSVTKLLTGLRYVPRVVVTDKLRSYGAAHREVLPSVEHRQSPYLNNRAENSHQPTRQRERAMPPTHRSPVPTGDDLTLCHLERGRRPARGRLTQAPQRPSLGSDTRHHTGHPTT